MGFAAVCVRLQGSVAAAVGAAMGCLSLGCRYPLVTGLSARSASVKKVEHNELAACKTLAIWSGQPPGRIRAARLESRWQQFLLGTLSTHRCEILSCSSRKLRLPLHSAVLPLRTHLGGRDAIDALPQMRT